eukprot:9479898-Pyramimonas_sp.AAC.1
MAAFADTSAAIQEMLEHVVEWILINITASLCDIPLEGPETAASASMSAAIQVMLKHVAEWISSSSTAIQEMSESEAVRIPNNIKAPVCDIPRKGLIPFPCLRFLVSAQVCFGCSLDHDLHLGTHFRWAHLDARHNASAALHDCSLCGGRTTGTHAQSLAIPAPDSEGESEGFRPLSPPPFVLLSL